MAEPPYDLMRRAEDMLEHTLHERPTQAQITYVAFTLLNERKRCANIVREWPKYYPESVFIPPKPGEHGKTVAGCSAATIRSMCPRIANVIETPDDEEIDDD